MNRKNKLTKNLIYVLVGSIIVYGIGITVYENIGDQRFTFADGKEYKRGIFATNPINKVSESWIQWELKYTDGSSETGRTGKNQDRFLQLSLVKSVEDVRVLQQADFIVYSDFSTIGKELCVGTPAMTIKQKVLVNGIETKVLKQSIVYNELDSRNILKGIGVRITPTFFEGQILTNHGPLKSGDKIDFILDANGRFEITETNYNDGKCLFTPIADGFIEGAHAEFSMVYGDPLDILLGTFPNKQTEITDQPVIVNQCVNGICGPVTIQESPDVINKQISESQSVCSSVYAPVCASDGKSYSNQCIADSFNANVIYSGACVGQVINQAINNPTGQNNPTGIDGIVGVCNPLVSNCSETSPDIQNYINQYRQDEFNFNSFEFIMLLIIGIVIIVTIASRIVKR